MHFSLVSRLILATTILIPTTLPAQVGRCDCGPGFDPTPVQIPLVTKVEPRAITNMDLLTLRDIKGVQISPDGKSVAFVLSQAVYDTNSYQTGLFVVDTAPGSIPRNLGSAGPPRWDRAPEPPSWSPDSRYITHLLKHGETWQVWRWGREGGTAVQLTHSPYGVRSFEWSFDGSKILYVVERPRDTREAKRVAERGVLYDGTYRFWEGKSIVEAELEKRPAETETWVYEVATGRERMATQTELKAPALQSWLTGKAYDSARGEGIVTPKLSPDGRKVAYRVAINDPEKPTVSAPLHVQSLDGGSAVALTPGAYWVSEFWWSPNSRELYFSEAEVDGRSHGLFVISADGGTPRLLVKGPEFLTQFSLDRRVSLAACVRESSTAPQEVALLDLHTGTVRSLVNVNPQFQNLRLNPAVRIEWKNKYGETGFGHLIKPTNYEPGKRYPLIVTTYKSNDGFLRGAAGDEYPIHVFAANGFAVLNFDAATQYHNRPRDFESAMRRLESPLASLDAALKVLDEMGIVDSRRRGLSGLSHGAEIVQFAISHGDLFQAAVSSGGDASDPYFYYLASRTWWRGIFSQWGLAGWPEEPKLSSKWRQFSSALNAERIQAPLLINASDSEYLFALKIYTSLEELLKPVEMLVYPCELHVKNQPKHRYEIYERNLDWFRFWLKGEEGDATSKMGHYRRWRELRERKGRDAQPIR